VSFGQITVRAAKRALEAVTQREHIRQRAAASRIDLDGSGELDQGERVPGGLADDPIADDEVQVGRPRVEDLPRIASGGATA
jgi:hypothetical protein